MMTSPFRPINVRVGLLETADWTLKIDSRTHGGRKVIRSGSSFFTLLRHWYAGGTERAQRTS